MTKRRSKKAPRRTAVAYLRVSTDAERQELGLKAQRRAIGAWARKEGVTILVWRVETISGGTPIEERPRLLRALAEVQARRATFLAVHRLDRLARNVLTIELATQTLERHKASLVCVAGGGSGDGEEDPTGELIRTVLAGVGRFERRMIGARTKAALAVKRHRGEALGRPGRERYGWRRAAGGRLEENPEEQATIRRAREMYAVEGVGIRAVGAGLAAEGRMNRRGRPFGLEELSKMLRGGDEGAPL